MQKKLLKITILILTVTLLTGALLYLAPHKQSLAEESLCPSNIDPDSRECLEYLREKMTDISNTNSKIENQLKDEEYKQLSLSEKISYIESQISQTTKLIESTQLEIAAFNVEIKILEDSIEEIEDSIGLNKQEITILEKNVNSHLTESYKYTFVTPLEIFLNSSNLEDILRKTKYLLINKEKDTQKLEEYNSKKEELVAQEEELSLERAKLQQVRLDLEKQQEEILVQKAELDDQKAEKAYLLSESEKKERELIATLDTNRIQQALLDEAMLQYIAEHGDQMADYGWVNAGSWIGNMGGLPNACSTGPHIHFSIDYLNSSYYDGYGQISPWSGYLTKGPDYYWQSPSGWKYYYVRSGSFNLPLSGTVILTQDHHILPRKSIDITTTKGYGAPVYAAMSGNLSKGTDRCGDTYAVIENPSTGLKTAYFHLQ